MRWDAADDWPAFEALYADAMERLGAVEALRFGPEYFTALRALPGVRLGTVNDAAGLLVGAIFLEGPQYWHYHLGARRPTAENQAMSFLFHRATQAAGAAGARALHLGGGATPAPDDTLLRFKRLFSPTRPRFYVARVIADRDRFTDLMSRWEANAGRPARWLLGYREPAAR